MHDHYKFFIEILKSSSNYFSFGFVILFPTVLLYLKNCTYKPLKYISRGKKRGTIHRECKHITEPSLMNTG